MSKASMLVCKGFRNKILQTGWLKQWKFIISHFWKLEVQGQGVNNFKILKVSLLDLLTAAL